MKKIIAIFTSLILAIILVSCGSKSDKFKLNSTYMNIDIGETKQIDYEGKCEFIVADDNIVSVTEEGLVTGLKKGETVILAEANSKKEKLVVAVSDRVIGKEVYKTGVVDVNLDSQLFGLENGSFKAPLTFTCNVFDDDVFNFSEGVYDINIDASKGIASDGITADEQALKNLEFLKTIFSPLRNAPILQAFTEISIPIDYKAVGNYLYNSNNNDLHIDVNNIDGTTFMVYGDNDAFRYYSNSISNPSALSTVLNVLKEFNYDFTLIQELSYNTIIKIAFPGEVDVIDDEFNAKITKESEPLINFINALVGGFNVTKKQVSKDEFMISLSLNERGRNGLLDFISASIPAVKSVAEYLEINDLSADINIYENSKTGHNHLKAVDIKVDANILGASLISGNVKVTLDKELRETNNLSAQAKRNNDFAKKDLEFQKILESVGPLLVLYSNEDNSTYDKNIDLLKLTNSSQEEILNTIRNLDNIDKDFKDLIAGSYSDEIINKAYSYENITALYESTIAKYEEALEGIENATDMSEVYNAIKNVCKMTDLVNALKTDHKDLYDKVYSIESDYINGLKAEMDRVYALQAEALEGDDYDQVKEAIDEAYTLMKNTEFKNLKNDGFLTTSKYDNKIFVSEELIKAKDSIFEEYEFNINHIAKRNIELLEKLYKNAVNNLDITEIVGLKTYVDKAYTGFDVKFNANLYKEDIIKMAKGYKTKYLKKTDAYVKEKFRELLALNSDPHTTEYDELYSEVYAVISSIEAFENRLYGEKITDTSSIKYLP